MKDDDKDLWAHYQINNVGVFSETHNRHDRVYLTLKKYIKSPAKILEIGFGDGYLLKKMSKLYDCCGADISQEVVERARRELVDVKFEVIGMDGKLSFGDGSFDGFVASEVLEHMTDEELTMCVSEIKRILKKGGYAFITVPAEENLEENECFCPKCKTAFHKWGHKQSWNIEKIKAVFGQLEVISLKEYFVRFEGKNFIEKIVGYVFFVMRNVANKFITVSNRSYLIILKK